MKKLLIPIIVSIMVFILAGYVQAGMPNPAAVYCSELGYQVKTITEENGGQYSVCVFPDGNTCDAWGFLKGQCGAEYSYCAKNGYGQITKTDGKNSFSTTYAVCVDGSTEIGNPLDLMGITERLSKQSLLVDELPPVTPSPQNAQPVLEGLELLEAALPTSFDWRTYNGFDWMTPVKDQNQCGSCWAFGSVGTIEAIYNLHQNQPNLDINLSEEYVSTDCNGNGKHGCCGGTHEAALTAITVNGVPDDACMVYDVAGYSTQDCLCDAGTAENECRATCPNKVGASDMCSLAFCDDACFDVARRLVFIAGYHDVGNEVADIKSALIAHGPLTTAIQFNFVGAGGGQRPDGVWHCGGCVNGCGTNHCVIITGWDDALGAWIIKNSWGNTDGNGDGYRFVAYNDCNVQDRVVWVEAKADTYFPSISIPKNTTFADTCVDGTSHETLNICNTGKADLSIFEITSDDTQFQVTEPLMDCHDLDGDGNVEVPDECSGGYPAVISPDFCYPFEVAFSPTSTGPKTASLTVRSSDIGKPALTVQSTGRGVQQDIQTMIVNDGNFGDVCLGTFRDLDLTINNSGGCDLAVTDISSSSGEFVIPSVLTYPLIIHPGSSMQLPIRFQPTSLGSKSAVITIDSSAPGGSTDVNVTGTVPPANITTSGELDFGQLCIGESETQTVQVCDTGKCNLTVTRAELVGDCDDLTLVSPVPADLPLVISPDFCFEFVVKFEPDDLTPPACSLEIDTDDPDSPTVVFPITATIGAPNIVIDPPALTGVFAFPATVADEDGTLGCFSERTVNLRNNGDCPLTITNILATGTANAADFSVTEPSEFPIYLPPGEETLSVTVRFTPQADIEPLAPTELTGTLTVVSDDPDGDAAAGLCGEGVTQSGVRILVTNISSGEPIPVDEVDMIVIQSKGKNFPSPINLMFSDQALSTATICGLNVQYHVDQETLPETDTTGSKPSSSYSTRAMEGNLQASENFTLGQCEFREFQLQLQDSNSEECLLLPKGAACTTDGECCSGKCKGPEGGKTCK